MKRLHIDMTGGFSGDIALAGLAALGFHLPDYSYMISTLLGGPVSITLAPQDVQGIAAHRLVIESPAKGEPLRYLADITTLLEKAPLPDPVRLQAVKTFTLLAEAEAAVHGIPVQQVHFHEIGAIDTIIDIVGFHLGLHHLGIQEVTASPVVAGCGTITIQHGTVPNPPPAVARLTEGMPVVRTAEPGECTTPTGAALLKSAVSAFRWEYNGIVQKSVYATGAKKMQTMPNIATFTLLTDEDDYSDTVTVIETVIDDMSGEQFGDLFTRLLAAGALDVTYAPVMGKKHRPATAVTVIIRSPEQNTCIRTLFAYSTTAGVRIRRAERIVMRREFLPVMVDGCEVRVKKLCYQDIEKTSPEWDDCVRASQITGRTPQDIYTEAKARI